MSWIFWCFILCNPCLQTCAAEEDPPIHSVPGSIFFSKIGTTQTFSGGSADAALRAWLLAVALHQDDLPPPSRLLPPHTHNHPTKDHRVKVPSGNLFCQDGFIFMSFVSCFPLIRCWTGCIPDIHRLLWESTVCRCSSIFFLPHTMGYTSVSVQPQHTGEERVNGEGGECGAKEFELGGKVGIFLSTR